MGKVGEGRHARPVHVPARTTCFAGHWPRPVVRRGFGPSTSAPDRRGLLRHACCWGKGRPRSRLNASQGLCAAFANKGRCEQRKMQYGVPPPDVGN